uniref:Uncharacterized protein n=1 Tax=Leersia perrieri TaxID=77586 RepID=A0A0D9XAX8_9ORYZ
MEVQIGNGKKRQLNGPLSQGNHVCLNVSLGTLAVLQMYLLIACQKKFKCSGFLGCPVLTSPSSNAQLDSMRIIFAQLSNLNRMIMRDSLLQAQLHHDLMLGQYQVQFVKHDELENRSCDGGSAEKAEAGESLTFFTFLLNGEFTNALPQDEDLPFVWDSINNQLDQIHQIQDLQHQINEQAAQAAQIAQAQVSQNVNAMQVEIEDNQHGEVQDFMSVEDFSFDDSSLGSDIAQILLVGCTWENKSFLLGHQHHLCLLPVYLLRPALLLQILVEGHKEKGSFWWKDIFRLIPLFRAVSNYSTHMGYNFVLEGHMAYSNSGGTISTTVHLCKTYGFISLSSTADHYS